MKAATVVAFAEPLELVDVPDPVPGARDAIVKVEASGICRSDWQIWHGEHERHGVHLRLPMIMGHEIAGTVAEIGDDVGMVRVGDRVTAPFHLACGHCERCRRGMSNLCDGLVNLEGGYAEYVRIANADVNLVALPQGIDYLSAAAMGCRYMTAFGALFGSGRLSAGEWLAVHGCGALGLSAIQLAAAAGARVIAVDIDEAKLDVARKQGAEFTLDARSDSVAEVIRDLTGAGADISVDAIGLPSTVAASLGCLRKGGRHVQVGLAGQSGVELPVAAIVARELRIVGSLGNPHGHFRELFSLVESGRCNPQALIAREVGLADITSVLIAMTSYQTVGFSILTMF